MSNDLNSLLGIFSSEVQELARKTREFLLNRLPNSIEQIDVGSKLIGYGYGTKMADTICVLMLYKSHVNLGFFDGVFLPDPHKLLEGTGKRHRHVKITKENDLKNPGLLELLEVAIMAHRSKSH